MKLFTIFLILFVVQMIEASSAHHLTVMEEHAQQNHQTSIQSTVETWLILYILGPIIFLSSFGVIWFNEKRAAIDAKRLEIGREICQNFDVTNLASAKSK
jgi:hypothetical protein